MRLPWQKDPPEHVDPHRPHAFQEANDAGLGALAPIGGGVGPQVADIAAANAVVRTMGCGVPGCGKPRDAEVHAPED